MLATGFSASFTSGEIFPDADDRTDIQPIAKGCAQATNMIVQVTGPLKKRRGFWWLGSVANPAATGRLIPFRRSLTDALMLEFGNLSARVWQANGSPLTSAGVQVSFATPYATAELPNLRFRQVADVIYFCTSDGTQPQALERLSDTSWQFNLLTFPNGPWQAENIIDATTVTVTGTGILDANPYNNPGGEPPSGAILTGQAVTITASAPIFSAANVGDNFRIRATTGSAPIRSWAPGDWIPAGWFNLSVGLIYLCVATAGSAGAASATTLPTQTAGNQSDGCNTWQYLHDGAGVVEITGFTSATVVTGKVVATLPVASGTPTSYWSYSAYGYANGWPTAWPAVVEERLVSGPTSGNLDFIDLTRTAGFTPLKLDYHPGQGTGQVVATDALRARLGNDGGQILWTVQDSFLLAGTDSAEYVISGGLFGDPLTPSTAIYRHISGFGSADVQPAQLEKGVAYVTTGGQTLRTLRLDLQQNDSGGDVSFLANHIAVRGFEQLCWIKAPDRVLWARMGDGGLAALTIYQEQGVQGWTTQALGAAAAGSLIVEDIVSLPGPSKLETLWMIVSGVLGGVAQRGLVMLSQVSDGLFMDFATEYAGAPVSEIGGLAYLAGETVRVLAGGAQIPDQVVTAGGTITVPAGTTAALVGLAYGVTFESLKLDIQMLGGTLMQRQRVTEARVDLQCAVASVGLAGQLAEKVSSRVVGDIGGSVSRRVIKRVVVAGATDTDPRLQVTESSAYDFGIFAIRPTVVAEIPARGM